MAGKKLLHILICGGSVPSALKGNAGAKSVARLARWLRWLACSLLSELFGGIRVLKTEQGKDPAASCFATWWQTIEAHILDHCVAAALRMKPQHLSLHFDGFRITKPSGGASSESILRDMEKVVREETGYFVEFAEKVHLTFVDQILRCPLTAVDALTDAEHTLLLRRGNGILMALACVLQDGSGVAPLCAQAAASATRAYRTVAAMCRVRLEPKLDWGPSPGRWLVHSEHDGMPRCTGVVVHPDAETCTVYEGGKSVSLPTSTLDDMAGRALDKKTIVLFEVFPTGLGQVSKLEPLLDLVAGCDGDGLD